jgi:hypothetical protein
LNVKHCYIDQLYLLKMVCLLAKWFRGGLLDRDPLGGERTGLLETLFDGLLETLFLALRSGIGGVGE